LGRSWISPSHTRSKPTHGEIQQLHRTSESFPRLSPRCVQAAPDPSAATADGEGHASIVSPSLFQQMLLHVRRLHRRRQLLPGVRHHGRRRRVEARGRGVTGADVARDHGGWAAAPDGAYSWGYCFKQELGGAAAADYCIASRQYPCTAGRKYYGRGPIQISYNYNYGPPGRPSAPTCSMTRTSSPSTPLSPSRPPSGSG
jgi:hypothetical protein